MLLDGQMGRDGIDLGLRAKDSLDSASTDGWHGLGIGTGIGIGIGARRNGSAGGHYWALPEADRWV